MHQQYDVIIIGAGPGGIYSAYELKHLAPELSVAVIEQGHALEKRRCPIDGEKIKSCIRCKPCSIMSGFGGAGAFSDGKYNITNDFGGTLYEHIGRDKALELMKYVDSVNMAFGGREARIFSTAGTRFKKLCMQNKLTLLDASVRHLGTDLNHVVLENLYEHLKDSVDFLFDTQVTDVEAGDGYLVRTKEQCFTCKKLIISVGRSGSQWMEGLCKRLGISTHSNRVDLGVRVELPAVVFSHLTDELYESKIVYRTEKFEDNVRTFCMNPNGIVVTENTNGIVTVNGHSYESAELHTDNTNFALLVSKHFSEPFNDSNLYGESIARLSNMLGGGVMVQRGSRSRPPQHGQTHRGRVGSPDACRDARRPQPRPAEADPRRHHRNDLRPGQDRAGYRERRYAALRRGGQVLQHGSRDQRASDERGLRWSVSDRRRQRHHTFAVPRFGKRRVRRPRDRGRALKRPQTIPGIIAGFRRSDLHE